VISFTGVDTTGTNGSGAIGATAECKFEDRDPIGILGYDPQ